MPYRKKTTKRAPRKRMGVKKRGRKLRYLRKSIPRSVFPMRKNCTMLYKNPSTTITTAGINAFYAVRLKCNSLYDLDHDDLFGNKQPLYYDTLLTATGPYRNYKVNAWKTIITIVNLETTRTLMAYFDPGSLAGASEADTTTEIRNRPYVQSRILTPIGSGGAKTVFKSFRKTKTFTPSSPSDDNYTGNYNGDPSNIIYSTLNVIPVDGSVTAYNFMIEVSHVFYCTLFNGDAVVS